MRSLLSIQNLIYFRIIDPQKFVCSSDPVGVIMLAFGTFLVDKLVHRFIFRFVKDIYFGYLKENFSECCGATLGNVPRRYIELSRLIRRSDVV